MSRICSPSLEKILLTSPLFEQSSYPDPKSCGITSMAKPKMGKKLMDVKIYDSYTIRI